MVITTNAGLWRYNIGDTVKVYQCLSAPNPHQRLHHLIHQRIW
ncbi:MAG: GH3 auxin-responsive promoter family protein [Cytophagales bacterium]|nr:GH3 auxin-responsive promoter family protein [Cytophagales bacterium]